MAASRPDPFLLGVNYPWVDYAEDFGSGPRGHLGVSAPHKYAKVKNDFVQMRECGVRVVRWFLFADGRGGFETRKEIPRKPDEFLLNDVGAAFQLAEAHELKLCFSLIDYLWLQDRPHPQTTQANWGVLQFAAGREAFLQNVLIPLFIEFRAHPALFAWEVANEPEWAIREFHRDPVAKMRLADFRAYAAEIVEAIHEFGHAAATLGSARLLWLRAWSELHLDFYQAHYYPGSELDNDASFLELLATANTLDKPLWLGELPAHDPSSPEYSLENTLTHCRDSGLFGAAIWRWTTPEPTGTDLHIGTIEAAVLQTWLSSKQERDLGV
jgi:hypothetical protein